jgi:hypothetical protein
MTDNRRGTRRNPQRGRLAYTDTSQQDEGGEGSGLTQSTQRTPHLQLRPPTSAADDPPGRDFTGIRAHSQGSSKRGRITDSDSDTSKRQGGPESPTKRSRTVSPTRGSGDSDIQEGTPRYLLLNTPFPFDFPSERSEKSQSRERTSEDQKRDEFVSSQDEMEKSGGPSKDKGKDTSGDTEMVDAPAVTDRLAHLENIIGILSQAPGKPGPGDDPDRWSFSRDTKPVKWTPLPWPTWDGNPVSFSVFHQRLNIKVQQDGPRGLLGDKTDAYYRVLEAFPLDKRPEIETQWALGISEKDTYGFLGYTWNVFGDKTMGPAAMKKLLTDKQKHGEPFQEFYTRWQRLLVESGAVRMDNIGKVALLRGALNTAMEEALIGPTRLPDDFNEVVTFLIGISSNLEITNKWKKHHEGFNRARLNESAAKNAEATAAQSLAMQRALTNVNSRGGRGGRGRGGRGRATGRQNPSTERAAWVSEAKRKERFDAGQCMRCGDPDHFARACPLSPPAKSTTAASTNLPKDRTNNETPPGKTRRPAKTDTKPRVEEVEESDHESEN